MVRVSGNNPTLSSDKGGLLNGFGRFLYIMRNAGLDNLVLYSLMSIFAGSVLFLPLIHTYKNAVDGIVDKRSFDGHTETTRYFCDKVVGIICGREITLHYPGDKEVFRIGNEIAENYNTPSDEEITKIINNLRDFIKANPKINSINIEGKYHKNGTSEEEFFTSGGPQSKQALERANYIKAKIEELAPELSPLIKHVFSRANLTLYSDLEEIIIPLMGKYGILSLQDFIERYNAGQIQTEGLSDYEKMRLAQIFDKRIEIVAEDTIGHDIVKTGLPEIKNNANFFIPLLGWLIMCGFNYFDGLNGVRKLLNKVKSHEERKKLEEMYFGFKGAEKFRELNQRLLHELELMNEGEIIIIEESKDNVWGYQKNGGIWKLVKQRTKTNEIVDGVNRLYGDDEKTIKDEYELFLTFLDYKITPENIRKCSLDELNDLMGKKIK